MFMTTFNQKITRTLPFLLLFILAACQAAPTQEPISPPETGIEPPATAAQIAEPTTAPASTQSETTAVDPNPRPAEEEAETAEETEAISADIAQLIAEHVRPAGTPNQLLDEKSPYLLQHAYNPVDWYPWGEEAFAKAAAEDKPIFLSIGYSTCHWCHVMEEESFEDDEVAALMNKAFISVKVDREERPDIDNIYMNVAQITGNRGGWPLTIIMTPDQLPFFVATYIPKGSRFERTGMVELIPQVEIAWQEQRPELQSYADQIITALQDQQTSLSGAFATGPVNVLDSRTLQTTFLQLDQSFDPVNGGFGISPKFPSPHNLLFLLRYGQRTGDEQALEMVKTTLSAMRFGGIYDQIGYGFHRYATDARWKLPHFEKMLYDQAMLSIAYTETYQASEDPFYEEVAREIFTYVLRDMTDPLGGFYSAEDADSEGEEGIFYFWTVAEIESLLTAEDAQLIITLSDMQEEGNFRDEASRQKIGENVIYWDQSPSIVAADLGLTAAQLDERLDTIRQTLFAVREERIHPHKDDKILTDWNGLMIASLAKAGQAFNDPQYTAAAQEAADFLLTTMRRESDGRLLHRYRDGDAAILANVDDYTFLVWGLLELYEATFDLTYLEAAIDLTAELDTYFWDEEVGGYYFTPKDGEALVVRQKSIYDGAIPSGNSIAMLNLLRLGRITANADYEAQAFKLTEAFYGQVAASPTAFTQLMSGLEFGIGPSYEVIIVGESGAADTNAMLSALRAQYLPNKVVLLRGLADDGPLAQLADYTSFYYAIDDQATAYVCQNYVCEFPTTDPEKMIELLLQSTTVETEEAP